MWLLLCVSGGNIAWSVSRCCSRQQTLFVKQHHLLAQWRTAKGWARNSGRQQTPDEELSYKSLKEPEVQVPVRCELTKLIGTVKIWRYLELIMPYKLGFNRINRSISSDMTHKTNDFILYHNFPQPDVSLQLCSSFRDSVQSKATKLPCWFSAEMSEVHRGPWFMS